jgi:hypothetical protein
MLLIHFVGDLHQLLPTVKEQGGGKGFSRRHSPRSDRE